MIDPLETFLDEFEKLISNDTRFDLRCPSGKKAEVWTKLKKAFAEATAQETANEIEIKNTLKIEYDCKYAIDVSKHWILVRYLDIQCPTCKGTGEIWSHNPICYDCGGHCVLTKMFHATKNNIEIAKTL